MVDPLVTNVRPPPLTGNVRAKVPPLWPSWCRIPSSRRGVIPQRAGSTRKARLLEKLVVPNIRATPGEIIPILCFVPLMRPPASCRHLLDLCQIRSILQARVRTKFRGSENKHNHNHTRKSTSSGDRIRSEDTKGTRRKPQETLHVRTCAGLPLTCAT